MPYPPYAGNGVALPSLRGPYIHKDVQMANFLVQADHDRLHAFCDDYLNDRMDGDLVYRPLFGHVMLGYARLVGYAMDEAGQKMGLLEEQDLCVWVPTIALRRVGGVHVPVHLAWLLAYILVDSPFAMATGREVFGFPKSMAAFDVTGGVQQPAFQINAMAFDPHDPEAMGRMEPLLTVEPIEDKQVRPPQATPWQNWEEGTKAVVPLLTGNEAGTVHHPWLDKAVNLFLHVAEPKVRVLLLKQFRDAIDPTRACYQAVIEAPIAVEEVLGGGLLHHAYRLTINDLPHYPIVDRLGLQMENGQQEVHVAFWADTRFILQQGEVMWEATGRAPQRQATGCGPLAWLHRLRNK